jgi:hypothetical protein
MTDSIGSEPTTRMLKGVNEFEAGTKKNKRIATVVWNSSTYYTAMIRHVTDAAYSAWPWDICSHPAAHVEY